MTRKDELLRVARIAVNTFQNDVDGPFVLPSGHKDDLIQRIYVVLLQLERKVWGKVIDKIETEMDKENESTDDQIWEIRDWCKEQKEAL